MIFDYVYIDQDGQLRYNKEEDFIIDDTEAEEVMPEKYAPEPNPKPDTELEEALEEEWLAELDAAIEEFLRQYADQARFWDDDL